MIEKTIKCVALLSILITPIACYEDTDDFFEILEEEEENPEPESVPYTGVDEELWIYFARFEEEGRFRGIDVDLRLADITGAIEDLGGDGVAGQCTYQSHFPNHVVIDRNFWDHTGDRGREFVVFHELGHCDLGRDHREDADPNGTCLSIMRSGVGDCVDNYSNLTRATYLDELFDPAFSDELIN